VRDFEGWYRAVYPRVVTTLSVTLGSTDEATDVSQEAMARAYERWSSVGEMDNPDGWVFRVALNEARRRGRRRATERRLRAAADPPPPPTSDALVELRELVDGLPPRMREVVVLRHVADLTEPMIAEVSGISRGTVSSTLRDAYDRLARSMANEAEETAP
jgi:RNA polymerase sigma factor (sigma-70 family)